MFNLPLVLLTLFYIPCFIFRSIIVRLWGSSYGIKILDDLFNPCNNISHTANTHERSRSQIPHKSRDPYCIDYRGKRKGKKRQHQPLQSVSSERSIEDEIALAEQALRELEASSQYRGRSRSREPITRTRSRSRSRSRNYRESGLLSEELL